MLALENGISGSIYNVGGGSHISVNEVLKLIEEIAGRNLNIDYQQTQKGDVRRTEADISLSRKELGYESGYDIKSGLENEFEWIRNNIDLLT